MTTTIKSQLETAKATIDRLTDAGKHLCAARDLIRAASSDTHTPQLDEVIVKVNGRISDLWKAVNVLTQKLQAPPAPVPAPVAAAPVSPKDRLLSLTRQKLFAVCKERGIKTAVTMTKDALADAIIKSTVTPAAAAKANPPSVKAPEQAVIVMQRIPDPMKLNEADLRGLVANLSKTLSVAQLRDMVNIVR